MSSALKPALPTPGGQSPGNPPTNTKPSGMPQHTGTPNPYTPAPLGHVAQNLAGLPHAHSNIGIPAQNMATNMTINQVPNIPQMGHSTMNQAPAHNLQAAHGSPIKASALPSANAAPPTGAMPAHGRPNPHPFIANAPQGSAHPRPDEEGTTLPPSQNSAQLMAVHRAQQQQHHSDQQINLPDRFKQQSNQQPNAAQPQLPSQQVNQQPAHQQPQTQQQQSNQQQSTQSNQQSTQSNQQQQQQSHQQSNGMASPSEAVKAPTIPNVPTPQIKHIEHPSSTPISNNNPPVQNHATENSIKPAVEAITASPPLAAPAPVSNATQSPGANVEAKSNATTNASPSIPTPTPGTTAPAVPTATPVINKEASSTEPTVQVATTPPKPAPTPKESSVQKSQSTLKLATTPRNQARKREQKPAKSESSKTSGTASGSPSPSKTPEGKSTGTAQNNRPPDKSPKMPRTPSEERKSKRTRIRTQPYQSPLPELALITKLSSTTTPSKNQDEKLIVFYKNEFLAVRNAEGGFYVCRAAHNVYKSSSRIKIRWFSQEKDKSYIPDFYDKTEFDCILTNLNMERVEKGRYNLPVDELERTENILKRALDVESGASAPSLTEEHPDGLDLSLFRDESQLKVKTTKSLKRKSTELSISDSPSTSKKSKRTKSRSKSRRASRSPAKKSLAKKNNQQKAASNLTQQSTSKESTSQSNRRSDGGRAERAKRRSEVPTPTTSAKTSPVVDQKKAKVLAKVAMKNAVTASTSTSKDKKKLPVKPIPSTSTSKPTTSIPSKLTTKASTRSHVSGPSGVSLATASTSAATTRRKKTKK